MVYGAMNMQVTPLPSKKQNKTNNREGDLVLPVFFKGGVDPGWGGLPCNKDRIAHCTF